MATSIIDATPTAESHGTRRLSGTFIVPAHDCQYGSQVKASDVLLVNFDRHAIGRDGLYLIEIEHADKFGAWRGCKRFDRLPSGLHVDWTGEGQWEKVPTDTLMRMHVVGHVKTVYRPVTA